MLCQLSYGDTCRFRTHELSNVKNLATVRVGLEVYNVGQKVAHRDMKLNVNIYRSVQQLDLSVLTLRKEGLDII